MRRAILVCALILSGGCSTTMPPATRFPDPAVQLMVRCERPSQLPAGQGAPRAAEALATVTANYAAHHRCADRADALQDWVLQQYEVTNGEPLGH